MIQFLELELTNFAIYPKASFKFATDQERPLTVIRGENESGKTTLVRAFLATTTLYLLGRRPMELSSH